MRIETHSGRRIVCGHIFPTEEIEPGQEWQSSGGSIVTVVENDGEFITYSWIEGGETRFNTKEAFAFQCRYCMVLPSKWYAGGAKSA